MATTTKPHWTTTWLPEMRAAFQAALPSFDRSGAGLLRAVVRLFDVRAKPLGGEERAAWDLYMARGLEATPERSNNSSWGYPGCGVPDEPTSSSVLDFARDHVRRRENCVEAARQADHALEERRKRFGARV